MALKHSVDCALAPVTKDEKLKIAFPTTEAGEASHARARAQALKFDLQAVKRPQKSCRV
jgi:hypothetical protein